MPDWNALDDAYGSADTVGAMLEELDAGTGEVDWDVLWSHLCHSPRCTRPACRRFRICCVPR